MYFSPRHGRNSNSACDNDLCKPPSCASSCPDDPPCIPNRPNLGNCGDVGGQRPVDDPPNNGYKTGRHSAPVSVTFGGTPKTLPAKESPWPANAPHNGGVTIPNALFCTFALPTTSIDTGLTPTDVPTWPATPRAALSIPGRHSRPTASSPCAPCGCGGRPASVANGANTEAFGGGSCRASVMSCPVVTLSSGGKSTVVGRGRSNTSCHASTAHAKKLLSPQRRYPWTKAPTNPSILRLSWIGHSTCLVQRQQTTILTDPIFSHRASPFQWTPIGVGRSQPAACEIDDLPPYIDLCIISHDHYDHLDKASVQALRERVGLWVVPLGTQKWMTRKAGVAPERVLEMKWWESVLLRRNNRRQADKAATPLEIVQRHSLRDNPSDAHPARDRPSASPEEEGGEEVWITCLPVQHWCSRTIWDRNYRLWASFAVLFPDQQQTFYYTGDTAWPAQNFPLFDQIRCYLPWPVSLAAIPIGAYNPKELNEDSHVSPPEAVQIHQALQAQQSVAIHHGSFPLSEEPLDEPSEWLSRATAEAGVAPRAFTTLPHGAALECKTVVPKALKR